MADPVAIVCHLVRDSGQAVLVNIGNSERQVWLPKAQIAIEHAGAHGRLRVVMPLWLAEEKGLAAVALAGQGSLF